MTHPSRHTLILGAAGQMTSVAARAICASHPSLRVTLADCDAAALGRLRDAIGAANVATRTLDLYDDDALRDALADVDFVVHGAGPFYKTGQRVMRACIAARASYMDIADDVESTLQALALDAEARAAGVTLYVGHGASPGLSNVLGLQLLERLDEAHELEVAWCVGEEPGVSIGRAVAEHTVHIGAGEYTGFRGGRRCQRESFEAHTRFPMPAPLGDYRLYECAHPEPVMFGFSHPQLRDAICWGGLHPQPLNGALRGIALAVRAGRLSMDDACGFLQAAAPGPKRDPRAPLAGTTRRGQAQAGRYALQGILRQVAARQCSLGEVGALLLAPLRGRRAVNVTSIAARARGVAAGEPCTLLAQGRVSLPAGSSAVMAAVTGYCEAAFFALAQLRGAAQGVAFAQMWAPPSEFFATLRALAAPAGITVEASVEPQGAAEVAPAE